MCGADYQLIKFLGLRLHIKRLMMYQQRCCASRTVLRLAMDLAENNRCVRILVIYFEIIATSEHSNTLIGSGQFAENGFGKASYFRNLEIVDSNNSLILAYGISTLAKNTNCNDIRSSNSHEWGNYFYYNGRGNNPQYT